METASTGFEPGMGLISLLFNLFPIHSHVTTRAALGTAPKTACTARRLWVNPRPSVLRNARAA